MRMRHRLLSVLSGLVIFPPILLVVLSASATLTVSAAPVPPQTPVITAPALVTTGVGGLKASVVAQSGCTYAWTITGGTITAGSGTRLITFTAGPVGTLNLSCIATNAAGTSSTPGIASVTVVAAPVTPIITAPASATVGATGLLASAPEQFGCTFSWTITSGTITAGVGTNEITFTAGAVGTLRLTCIATNAAGTHSSTGVKTVAVAAVPGTPVITVPTPVTTGDAGLKASVPAQSGCTYAWTITGGAITVGSGTRLITFTAGPVGTLNLSCIVTNAAGTSSTPGIASVTVVAAPVTPVITAPASATVGATGLVAMAPEQSGCTFTWAITGGIITAGAGTNQIAFTAVAVGTLRLTCIATNAAGTHSSTSVKTVAVVVVPGTPVITVPTPVTTGDAGLKASVPAQSGCTYAWTIFGGTITAGSGTRLITFTSGPVGTLNLSCIVTNAAGTSSTPGIASASIVAAPVTPVITAPVNTTVGTTGLLASAPNQAGCTFIWTITGGTITTGVGTNQITFTADAIGILRLTCIATNAAGTRSATGSATVKVGDVSPNGLSYSINPAVYARGVTITPNSPTSTGGPVVSYSVSPALPTGLGLNLTTGVISGIPTVVVAATPYTVTARNSGGSTTAVLTITVNETPPGSLSYSQNPAIYTIGMAITPNTPTSTGGAVVSYSVSPALPSGLGLNLATGVISGMPTVVVSASIYTVTGSNSGGITSCPVKISVVAVPTSPPVTPVVTIADFLTAGKVGLPATTQVQGEGASYLWTLENGTITAGQGTRSIFFTAGSKGSLVANVTVTNAVGNASVSVNATVVEAPVAGIHSPGKVFYDEAGLVASVPDQSSMTYMWTITNGTSGGLITTGNQSNSIVYSTNPNTGDCQLSVAVQNQAGDTAAETVALQVVENQFLVDSSIDLGRSRNTVTVLSDGKVLVAGGIDKLSNPVSSTAIYDPTSKVWSSGPPLQSWRDMHSATLLLDGKVLLVGGDMEPSTELYDPATNAWSNAGALYPARNRHTATLLLDGSVLVVGGKIGSIAPPWNTTKSVKRFNPATQTWSDAPDLLVSRAMHTATLLPNGKVLVTGGYDASTGTILSSSELYDPSTNTWSQAGKLIQAREFHRAVRLNDGRVLIVGGSSNAAARLSSCEIYDPITNAWASIGNLANGRFACFCTLLSNGKVLVVGGSDVQKAEVFDMATQLWSQAGSSNALGDYCSGGLLRDGKVLTTCSGSPEFYKMAVAGPPPSDLIYSEGTPTYRTGTAITPNVPSVSGGLVKSYSVFPNLPVGLHLDTTTGIVTGTPTVLSGSTAYIVTATNDGGSATASLAITVNDVVPLLPVISSFTAASPTIINGSGTTLSWTVGGAINLSLDHGIGDVTGLSSKYVAPTTTVTYMLTATNAAGSVTATTTVTVASSAPVITSFNALPGTLFLGESVELYAIFTGGTGYVEDPSGARLPIYSGVDIRVTPALVPGLSEGVVIYRLTVVNEQGLAGSASISVHVVAPPSITSFTATPTSISPGDPVRLTPVYSNGTATITPGDLTIGPDGSGQPVTLYPTVTTTYTLAVSPVNLYGGTPATSTVTVTVGNPGSGIWMATGSMSRVRSGQASTLLPGGKVLITGGDNLLLASAELYDPATGTSTVTGPMLHPRLGHTATLMPNGKVLIVGGDNLSPASAEVYDPSTGLFTDTTGGTSQRRMGHSATLLPNGKVLLAGGDSQLNLTAELYDPANGLFSITGGGQSPLGHTFHTATLLANGDVLLAGGVGYNNAPMNTAFLYNTSVGRFNLVSLGAEPIRMSSARAFHTATLLPDGKVLLVGGRDAANNVLATGELFDPSQGVMDSTTYGQCSPAGALSTSRLRHTATLLPSGLVLLSGGSDASGFLSSAEVYDPSTSTAATVPPMAKARGFHTATLLTNGKVLVAGGSSASGSLSDAELFDPQNSVAAPAPDATISAPSFAILGATGLLAVVPIQSNCADFWMITDGTISDGTGTPSIHFALGTSGTTTLDALVVSRLGIPSHGTTTTHAAVFPVISSFSSSSSTITSGSGTTLTWVVSGASSLNLDNGIGDVTGQTTKNIAPTATTTYTLTATNSAGLSVTAQVTVNVVPVIAPPVISSFTAASPIVINGSGTTLSWAVGGAISLSVDNGIGDVTGLSSKYVAPTTTVTYMLTATNAAGSVTATTTVTVASSAPVITSFNALPGTLFLGESVELYAIFTGGTGYVEDPSGARLPIYSGVDIRVTPALVPGLSEGVVIYRLTVVNEQGLAGSASISVHVVAPPSITSFTATPTSISPGDPVRLTPVYSNGTATITPGDLTIGPDGSGQPVTLYPTVTTTYTLAVSPVNLYGGTPATSTVTVTVGNPGSGIWMATGSMSRVRSGQASTLLPGGKVLITGGDNLLLASAELYDPATGTSTVTGPMLHPRLGHTATLMPNGKVLIVGGDNLSPASAEVYDPSTGLFTDTTGGTSQRRMGHSATLLPNGKVLLAGGDSQLNLTAELYDPANGLFSITGGGQSPLGHTFHTATLLANGDVLLAGGVGYNNAPMNTAFLYNTSVGRFNLVSLGAEPIRMSSARAFHTATLLPDGKVLLVGGRDAANNVLATGELFDPSQGVMDSTTYGQCSPAGALSTSRLRHTATLLPSGLVLLSGGSDASGFLSSAEVYDPSTSTAATVPPMAKARGFHTATLLTNGKVLVAGGSSASGSLSDAELFDPQNSVAAPAPDATISAPSFAILGATGLLAVVPIQSNCADFWMITDGTISDGTGTPSIHFALGTSGTTTLDALVVSRLGIPSHGTTTTHAAVFPVISSFSSSSSTITSGSGTTLTWVVSGASSLNLDNGIGDVTGQTTKNIAPTVTTTYTLTATNATGLSVTGQVTVTVIPEPVISSFTATPETLKVGEACVLTATFSGGTAVITPGNLQIESGKSVTVSPSSTTTYTLTLTPPVGLPVTKNVSVTVNPLKVGAWTMTGSMVAPRRDHTATLLDNGKVLVIGWMTSAAEIYDPSTGEFVSAGSTQVLHGSGATATCLKDGRVLIVGGNVTEDQSEIYDPGTNTFQLTGALQSPRFSHSASLLKDGRVLIAGGQYLVTGGSQSISTCEVFDPQTNSFLTTGMLLHDRATHGAAVLPDGRVLVLGGLYTTTSPGYAAPLASAEIYDPNTGVFSATGNMGQPRSSLGPVGLPVLSNGKVLVIGGWYDSVLAATELFDPSTGQFIQEGSLPIQQCLATATLLPDGLVLLTGGVNWNTTIQHYSTTSNSYLYDPTTAVFTPAADLNLPREEHTATLLPNGQVLIAGGTDVETNTISQSAELFSRGVVLPSPVVNSFTSDRTTIHNGESVNLSATYFGGIGIITPGYLLISNGSSVNVFPTTTTVYTITVTNAGGARATSTVLINVGPGMPVYISVGGFNVSQPPAMTPTVQSGISNLFHPSIASCSNCHAGGVGGKRANGYDHASPSIGSSCISCHEAGSDLVGTSWNGATTKALGAGDTRPHTLTNATATYKGVATIEVSPNHFYLDRAGAVVDCSKCHVTPTGVGTVTTGSAYDLAWAFRHPSEASTYNYCYQCHPSGPPR